MVIEPQFEIAHYFNNKLASALVNPFTALYIDREGNKVWTPKNFR